jgi:hypothetical protein
MDKTQFLTNQKNNSSSLDNTILWPQIIKSISKEDIQEEPKKHKAQRCAQKKTKNYKNRKNKRKLSLAQRFAPSRKNKKDSTFSY